MQLFESSPEEDNTCPQVQQGPPPVPRCPQAGCLPLGKEKPGRGGGQFGESWLGVIYLFIYFYIRLRSLPPGHAGRAGSRLEEAARAPSVLGWSLPCAVPWVCRYFCIRRRRAPGKLGLCLLLASGWSFVCLLGWGGLFGGWVWLFFFVWGFFLVLFIF